MHDKITISNIAIAKELLGEDSSSFKTVEREAELFEIMFPGVLEYVNNSSEKEKKYFLEALELVTEIDRELLEKQFINFIYPVRLIKDKLQIN